MREGPGANLVRMSVLYGLTELKNSLLHGCPHMLPVCHEHFSPYQKCYLSVSSGPKSLSGCCHDLSVLTITSVALQNSTMRPHGGSPWPYTRRCSRDVTRPSCEGVREA